jgi:predicted outer membrane repeat protein
VSGGGIAFWYYFDLKELRDFIFRNNKAGLRGGAIYFDNFPSYLSN